MPSTLSLREPRSAGDFFEADFLADLAVEWRPFLALFFVVVDLALVFLPAFFFFFFAIACSLSKLRVGCVDGATWSVVAPRIISAKGGKRQKRRHRGLGGISRREQATQNDSVRSDGYSAIGDEDRGVARREESAPFLVLFPGPMAT